MVVADSSALVRGCCRFIGFSAWLLPIHRLYNHGLPLAGTPTTALGTLAAITHRCEPPPHRRRSWLARDNTLRRTTAHRQQAGSYTPRHPHLRRSGLAREIICPTCGSGALAANIAPMQPPSIRPGGGPPTTALGTLATNFVRLHRQTNFARPNQGRVKRSGAIARISSASSGKGCCVIRSASASPSKLAHTTPREA